METSAREPIVNIPLAYLDLCSAHVCTRHDAISDERAFSNMMNYGLSLNEQEKKLISSFAVFQENKVLTCSIQGRRLGTSKKTKIQAATATALTPTTMATATTTEAAWRLLTAATAQRQRNNSAATAGRFEAGNLVQRAAETTI